MLYNAVTTDRSEVRAERIRMLMLVALAVVNAALFQPLFGFYSGKAPTPVLAALPHLLLAAVNAGALYMLVRSLPVRPAVRARDLLLIAVFARLAYLVIRTFTGAVEVDPDLALFERYAQTLVGGQYPEMEYPQGALALFTLGYLPSLTGLASFAVAFPLLMVAFDLVSLASLAWLGRLSENGKATWAVLAFYAVSPFTLELWYGKFDAAPAALLVLGLALFAAGRLRLSAIALAAGFLVKWFPGIAIAFLVVCLLRARRVRDAIEFAAVAAVAVALPLVPFWLASPARFLYTYGFHSGRTLMAESVLYVPAYFLEPAARLAPHVAPWHPVKSALVTNERALAVQILAIGMALAVAALLRARWQSAVPLAAIGVALFVCLNRAFSPQYVLVLIAAYGAGLIALPSTRRLAPLVSPAFVLLTLANYLVWPMWWRYWLPASAAFLLVNLVIVSILAFGAVKLALEPESSHSP